VFTAQLWRAWTPLAPQHGPAANTSAIFRDPRGKTNICWQVFL